MARRGQIPVAGRICHRTTHEASPRENLSEEGFWWAWWAGLGARRCRGWRQDCAVPRGPHRPPPGRPVTLTQRRASSSQQLIFGEFLRVPSVERSWPWQRCVRAAAAPSSHQRPVNQGRGWRRRGPVGVGKTRGARPSLPDTRGAQCGPCPPRTMPPAQLQPLGQRLPLPCAPCGPGGHRLRPGPARHSLHVGLSVCLWRSCFGANS